MLLYLACVSNTPQWTALNTHIFYPNIKCSFYTELRWCVCEATIFKSNILFQEKQCYITWLIRKCAYKRSECLHLNEKHTSGSLFPEGVYAVYNISAKKNSQTFQKLLKVWTLVSSQLFIQAADRLIGWTGRSRCLMSHSLTYHWFQWWVVEVFDRGVKMQYLV